ncbi:MAG: radical SAM protein [Rhodospirillales bacterium]|jgi:wyosine [tRNA(Phe)-imidazoG37] synthetase (radical SAM superfamily)|nr:radical SAM protein [Rhodospirillales bacterium]
MSHIFGPVPSRRLGRSLGIDLIPHKTCSYDCIYCQVGRTSNKTLERREWVPLEAVLADLGGRLSSRPDYITLSGSGEPTLYSRIGELIDAIRAMTDIPIAVLTNGSLLWQPEVREELRDATLVIPSLDAGDAAMFQAVNRPHPDLEFDRMVDGLAAFRREFSGKYWLEVMLLAGHTALEAEVRKIAALVERIQPDRVQINTATRPTAETYAQAAVPARLRALAKLFSCPVDVVENYDHRKTRTVLSNADRTSVCELVRRRPCTVDDIADALQFHRLEVIKLLGKLQDEGTVGRCRAGGRVFYFAVPERRDPRGVSSRTRQRGEERHEQAR